jgi:transcriptional regulator with XRE-family HTH domain
MTETQTLRPARKNGKNQPIGSPFLTEHRQDDIQVGERVRALRTEMGLSIRALADRSGLNVNTLSLIENGHTSPSVSTLQQIAQSLQVPISVLFEINRGEQKAVFQKNGQRPHAGFAHGMMEDLATGMPRFGAEPMIITLNPKADSGKHPIVHTGREFVYCLDGQIAYTVNDETFFLEPGDSLFFEAYLPHHWKNLSDGSSRALLVLCPTDGRDNPTERHLLK